MRKIVFLLVAIGAMFTSCDPMEDVYNEIGDVDETIVGVENYTLTDDDYAELGLDDMMFATEDEAKELLPPFLATKYPYWGLGSSVLIDYNLAPTGIEGVSELISANTYTLAKADYAASGSEGAGFYPSEDPTDYLTAILSEQYPDAVAGEVALLQYKQYTGVPVVGVFNLVDSDFVSAGTLLDWTSISVTGEASWEASNYGAKMNAFDGEKANTNEDWLVSSEIDLTDQDNPLFQVTQILNYAGDLDWYNILISTDYDGDVTTATWDTITVSPAPEGSSWTAVTSDDYSLSAYEGETIHIAFKYQSDDVAAATWEIEDVYVKVIGVEGETVDLSSYYQYTAEGYWQLLDKAYYLSASDYDSMGTGSGEPGQYNNFSSTALPENYLPRFLANKFPYAQEEDAMEIIYKYYSGGALTLGNIYTYTNGVWEGYQASLQFGNDGSTWVPDNTIRYELIRTDYDYMSAQLVDVAGYESAASSMGYYGNLDRRPGNANYWSGAFEENAAGVEDMIATAMAILLDKMDPTAAEGQKYLMTYDIYNGTNTVENTSMIKTGGVWVRNN